MVLVERSKNEEILSVFIITDTNYMLFGVCWQDPLSTANSDCSITVYMKSVHSVL